MAQTQACTSDHHDLDVSHMEAMTHGFDDLILDTPFTVEEVENALTKPKTKRSGGVDGLVAEHLKHGGSVLTVWLKCILNSVICFEQIPASLKLGMILPVFKGKGPDPMICSNYRGITLKLVLSKCLEILILERLESRFCERGFTHTPPKLHIREVSHALTQYFQLNKSF